MGHLEQDDTTALSPVAQPAFAKLDPAENLGDSQDVLDLLSGGFPQTLPQPAAFAITQTGGLLDLLSGKFDSMESQPSAVPAADTKGQADETPVADAKTNRPEDPRADSDDKGSVCGSASPSDSATESDAASEPERAPLFLQQSKSIQDLISESSDEDAGPEESDEEESGSTADEDAAEAVPLSSTLPVENPLRAIISWNEPSNAGDGFAHGPPKPAGNKFIDVEAEVEEDEFMNHGGIDGEDVAGQNEYDKTMLADSDEEPADLGVVLDYYQQQVAAEDQERVNTLINDVTSGALRKRQARDDAGMGLDLFDEDDEAEALLRRIRAQMGMGSSRKKVGEEYEEGSLAALAANPQTQAFANCFLSQEPEQACLLSSSDEDDDKDTALSSKIARLNAKSGLHQLRVDTIAAVSIGLFGSRAHTQSRSLPESCLPAATGKGQELLSQMKARALKRTISDAAQTSAFGIPSQGAASRLLSKRSLIQIQDTKVISNVNGKTVVKSHSAFRLKETVTVDSGKGLPPVPKRAKSQHKSSTSSSKQKGLATLLNKPGSK
ncbi:hypothetical protein HDU91_005742 [Kappamyces sp. JEL0680]|nr:hypothetical protein HDU91_005742 [Kappamyces sp. JEL0680]